jgi:shikimate dehydrogenase
LKRAGVIGHPLGHSISPAVFQAAFDSAGIDARYDAWPVAPDDLEAKMNELRMDDVLGANVTIPHKETVIPFLDRVDERAQQIGAVNTIVNDGGQLVGHNTDISGFARSLKEDAGFDPKQKRTAIIGAGGAARAVALALVEGGATLIYVTGRSVRRIDKLVADLRPLTSPGITLTWCYYMDGVYQRLLPDVDLLVNCTPVGTKTSDTNGRSPVDAEYLPSKGIVFDLVYNPPETPLLKSATECGAKAVSGLGMLVYQAADSFRLWTGKDAPVEKMMGAGKVALGAPS